jgi:hypothetical protein
MDRGDVKPRVRLGQNPRPHLFILSLAWTQTGHLACLSGGLTQRVVSLLLATLPRLCAQGF